MSASEPRPRVETGREPDLLTYIWNLPNFHVLQNNPQKVLDAIDKFNTEEKRLINIGPKKGVLIDTLISEKKPSIMIELGGYVGYSAIRFGDALKRAGGKKYYSFEIDPINASVAKLLIELSGLQDVVSVIVAPSHESLANVVKDSLIESIEILFVDHWKDRYIYDLWLVERLGLLKKGESVIVADNISPEAERGTEYVDWLNASQSEKEGILRKYSFGADFENVDLVKTIKEKGVRDSGIDLGNVPGVPSYVYETKLHEFRGNSGRTDGVAITNVL
ncbi:O-methyltransferase [Penicillium angulare]|uniref:O-methyltransferase n=1 Tax=Penicillium angulare TaxID=116970 RepID=UPI00253F672A|nr:O-methyltransferase [Penicillium angulare]KAJ5291061.1 O-methyltransferase [Penicillium angulare]